MAQNLCNDMTALKRSLEIKLENILLLKIWQLVGHLLKFKTLHAYYDLTGFLVASINYAVVAVIILIFVLFCCCRN